VIRLEEIPEPLRHLVAGVGKLEHPEQGMTSEVAFAGDVVVKWATNPLYRDWLRREQRVLSALAGSRLRVAGVLGYLDFGEELWLLTERLPGEQLEVALARGIARAERDSLLGDVGAQLARLHATPIPPPLREDRPFLDRVLAEAGDNLTKHPDELDGGTATLLEQLHRSRPADLPARLIHGDFRPDNILVDGGRVSAFVDWSGGGSGDPRMDVAFITSDIGDTAAFYEAYGQPPLDPAVQRWFLDLYAFF
jgi:aminoglycoside phosphotransferase (APT) family kinase protein